MGIIASFGFYCGYRDVSQRINKMETINVITSIFLIIIGVIIKNGKMYNLIAGYNTMPQEKKKNFDITGFASLMRNCFVLMGMIIIVGHYILSYLELIKLTNFLIIISVLGILPIFIIKGKEYDKN